jgi:hypothetical protein
LSQNAQIVNPLRRFLRSLLGSKPEADAPVERRNGGDRRSGAERRAPTGEQLGKDRRSGTDRRAGRDRRTDS